MSVQGEISGNRCGAGSKSRTWDPGQTPRSARQDQGQSWASETGLEGPSESPGCVKERSAEAMILALVRAWCWVGHICARLVPSWPLVAAEPPESHPRRLRLQETRFWLGLWGSPDSSPGSWDPLDTLPGSRVVCVQVCVEAGVYRCRVCGVHTDLCLVTLMRVDMFSRCG